MWNLMLREEVFVNIQQLTDIDYGRICKTSDSGPVSKYAYRTLNSFARIPLTSGRGDGVAFGLLSISSFTRRKRFTMNSVDLSDFHVSFVDVCGNLVNFHGRDNSFDLRILVEN